MKNFTVAAPGVGILSDFPNNTLGTMTGTSMSTPHVVGVAALVIQNALASGTELTPGDVARIIKLSADDLGAPGVDGVYGWGLVDAAAALQPVGGTSFPTGPTVNSGLVTAEGSSLGSSSAVGLRSLNDALSGAMMLDRFTRLERCTLTAFAPTVFATNFLQELSSAVFSTLRS
jgi:subtilisin family serine protease